MAITPEHYFDDAYYFKVRNYNVAVEIIHLLEAPESVFGGFDSHVLPQSETFELFFNDKNYVEAGSQEVNAIRCGGQHTNVEDKQRSVEEEASRQG